jgi:heme-degrading monooxygenase HmoA
MHARVWHLRVLPGKLEELLSTIQSLAALARKQEGFRGFIVLRADGGTTPEVQVVAIWNSLTNLRATEKNLFVTQAIARLMTCCQSFPSIHEHEVLVSEFAAD